MNGIYCRRHWIDPCRSSSEDWECVLADPDLKSVQLDHEDVPLTRVGAANQRRGPDVHSHRTPCGPEARIFPPTRGPAPCCGTTKSGVAISGTAAPRCVCATTLVERKGNFVIAEMKFQAQRLDSEWINVVSLLRLGQMAPNFSSPEPRVLIGEVRPDRWFEAKGIFELASGEVGIE